MTYLKWLLPITVLYVLLTGNIEPLNLLLGLLLALGIVALIRPSPEPIVWTHLPRATMAAFTYLLLLLWDLIASGFEVARLILQADPNLRQGIVAIPAGTDQAWVATASAQAITLTPGELVVEIGEDGTLYTHTLDVADTLANSPAAQARRARQLEEINL